MANRYDRQLGIIKPNEINNQIHILGCGGIGSWTALTIAKMGCDNIVVYDDDKVEDHNVASQFYKEKQIGKYKVDALMENIYEQTGCEIKVVKDICEEEYITSGLILITIDSMKERIRLGKIYEDNDIRIIDARMGGLSFEMHNVHSSNYLSTTVPPENVENESCTEKSISFNCFVIAGLIANQVKKYFKGENYQKEILFDLVSMSMFKKDVNINPPIMNAINQVIENEINPPVADTTGIELSPF